MKATLSPIVRSYSVKNAPRNVFLSRDKSESNICMICENEASDNKPAVCFYLTDGVVRNVVVRTTDVLLGETLDVVSVNFTA